jgi:hypothetical protein
MNLNPQHLEFFIDVYSLLRLFLALQGVTKGQISISIVLVHSNGVLQGLCSTLIVRENVVKNACVVENQGVLWVEFYSFLIVLKGILQSTCSLHIDAEVMVDPSIARVLLEGLLIEIIRLIPAALLVQKDGKVDL